MTELIQKYLDYLRVEKNFSSLTEISYSTDLSQFASFVKSIDASLTIHDVDSDIIRAWLVDLMKNEELEASSVARKLSAVKSFFKFLLYKGYIKKNPSSKVVAPKKKKHLPVFVTDKDINELIDTVEGDDFLSLRDNLILEMFYMTGMRRAELIGLKNVDVDLAQLTLLVTGKRNKQRLIPISVKLRDKIVNYQVARKKELENISEYLFVRENGMQLYPVLVYRIIVEQLKKIPILAKASPHVLRHTFATSMLNAGADINAVKEILGHASLAATEVYTHTSFEELKNIYNKAHPRA